MPEKLGKDKNQGPWSLVLV